MSNWPDLYFENHLVIDLLSLCNSSSRGDVVSVKKFLLRQNEEHVVSQSARKYNDKKEINIGYLRDLAPPSDTSNLLHKLLFWDESKSNQDRVDDLIFDNLIPNIQRKRLEHENHVSKYFKNYQIAWQRPDLILRAFLLLPPWSETPWIVSRSMIILIQRRRKLFGSEMILCHTFNFSLELKLFISCLARDTIFPESLAAQSRQLEILFHLVLQPLSISINEHDVTKKDKYSFEPTCNISTSGDNRHYSILFDLIPCMLSAARRLDNVKLLQTAGANKNMNNSCGMGVEKMFMSIVFNKHESHLKSGPCVLRHGLNQKVYERRVRTDMILPFLTLINDIIPFMRSYHFYCLRRIIFRAICSHMCNNDEREILLVVDFQGLIHTIVKSISEESGNINIFITQSYLDNNTPSWGELLLYIYFAASVNESTLFFVESFFKSTFSSLPYHFVSLLVTVLQNVRICTLPTWVYSNILLLVIYSQQYGPRLVYSLICDASGRSLIGFNVIKLLSDIMVQLPTKLSSNNNDDNKKFLTIDINVVKLFFKGAWYAGFGVGKYNGPMNSFEMKNCIFMYKSYVQLIHSSLFLGVSPPRNSTRSQVRKHTLERAKMWLNIASAFLEQFRKEVKFHFGLVMAITIFIVIFFDVPYLQSKIEQCIVTSLKNYPHKEINQEHDMISIYCAIVNVITCSITQLSNNHGIYDLKLALTQGESRPISSIFNFYEFMSLSRKPQSILEFASGLSELVSGREMVLDMLKKYSFPLIGDFSIHSLNYETNSTSWKERIIISLEGMFMLIRTDPYRRRVGKDNILDQTSFISLDKIIQLIIWNNQPQPLQCRTFFLNELIRIVNGETFDPWVEERMLNATIFTLLGYFCPGHSIDLIDNMTVEEKVVTQLNNILFVPERLLISCQAVDIPSIERKQQNIALKEDFPNLIRLLLAFISNNKNSDKSASSISTSIVTTSSKNNGELKHNVDLFLECMLCGDRSNLFNLLHPIDGENKIGSGINDSNSFSRKVAYHCLVAILKHLLYEGNNASYKCKGGFSQKLQYITTFCTLLQNVLIGGEVLAWNNLSKYIVSIFPNEEKMYPSWTSLSLHISNSFRNTNFIRSIKKYLSPVLASLCSIIGGHLFMLHYAGLSQSNGKMDDLSLVRLSTSISVFLDMKRHFTSKVDSHAIKTLNFHDKKQLILSLGEGFPISCFFHCAKESIMMELSRDWSSHKLPHYNRESRLRNIHLLFFAICDCCDHIEYSCRRKNLWRIQDSVIILWDIYLALAKECRCINLIQYLRFHCLNNECKYMKHSEGNHKSSQMSLRSSHDIDYFVRHIRWKVLSSIWHLISFLLSCTLEINNDVFFLFYLRITHVLCHDLCDGLYGYSGGITLPLFRLFIHVIEDCLKAVNHINDNFFLKLYLTQGCSNLIQEFKENCKNSANILWKALCTFNISDYTLFKPALMVCILHLPKISRRLELFSMFMPILSGKSISKIRESNRISHLALTIHQIIRMLRHDHSVRISQNFCEIIVKDNCSEIRSKEKSKQFINTNTRSERYGIDKESHIKIVSNKICDWAFTSSLQAVECVWLESFQILNYQSNSLNLEHVYNKLYALKLNTLSNIEKQNMRREIIHHASEKVHELRSILEAVTTLFDSVYVIDVQEHVQNDAMINKKRSNYICATLLSWTGKLRLCSCMEQISITLKSCIEIILYYKKNVGKSSNKCHYSNEQKNPFRDLMLTESITCLLAWFCPKDINFSTIDFTQGFKHWFCLERQQNSLNNSKKRKVEFERESIIDRISEVNFYVEELDICLQKLYASYKNGIDSATISRENIISDMIMKKILHDNVGLSSEQKEFTQNNLREIVETFIARLTSVKSRYSAKSYYESSNYSLNYVKKVVVSDSLQIHPKRKLCDIYEPKKATRECVDTIRSRNGVVDNWLQLDRELGEEEHDDDFGDLEDFLVEG